VVNKARAPLFTQASAMRIVHLNKLDIQGGAARAAYRLHKGLQRIGHESSMIVAARTSDDPTVIPVNRPSDLVNRVRRGLRQYRIEKRFTYYQKSRPPGYELFSEDTSDYGPQLLDQIPDTDVINLHWVPGFLDYKSFFSRISRGIPLVWTLHDMNAFTGGCHYDLGCGRYLEQCGACPQLGSRHNKDLSRRTWMRKHSIFSRIEAHRLRFVTPSKWLAAEVRRSPLLAKFEVTVIPYGLDLQDFSPRDKAQARYLLGLPPDAKVVLFVAERTDSPRKGFSVLAQVLNECTSNIKKLVLVSVGQAKPDGTLKAPSMHLGALSNDRFLSIAYSAADIFVIPSLQDNLPNTVMEAMACGVPVVGFGVGGIPDMIRQGKTGLVVDAGDMKAMANAIIHIVNGTEICRSMGVSARETAVKEYSFEMQAGRYADLYSKVLGDANCLKRSFGPLTAPEKELFEVHYRS
jgi:glycosyltransferase involved in cell wall biosynthesis